ncbi:abnormal spindle-like microcephaly-associated protein [Achlya hypogyna]|uniref:Abnormal spindle-like microcephaly-associated protein n=1 Tax=Achlya hypogyna TaxID=1202772 RepID=A0A1V9Z804_ACHHY|nr:abnormal spindle-like microcephaly-associated protein [Achlya hypogyna]
MDARRDKENLLSSTRKRKDMHAAASPQKPPSEAESFLLHDFHHVPELDFGSVDVGQTKVLTLGFVNGHASAEGSVVIEDVMPRAFAGDFFVDRHAVIIVSARSTRTINVVFTPTKPGRVNAKLCVRVNKRFRLTCTLRATTPGASSLVVAKRPKLSSRKSKPEASTSQWWKKRRIVYDDQWAPKQEEGFQKWLNFTLLGAHFAEIQDETPLTQDKYYQLRQLAITRLESKIRLAAHSIYNNAHTDDVLYRLQREVTAKHLTIRADRPLHADLGLQNDLIALLNQYHPLWLTLGLEVVLGLRFVESLGDLIHPSAASTRMPLFLRRLVAERIVNDPVLALKHPSLHLGVNRSEAYLAKLRVHTLVKCFMLVYFLDQAHANRHVDHIALPCLFRPEASAKTSRQILYDFTQKFLSQEGNVLRHLQALGYSVMYEQSVLEEMDMRVHNLTTDLRDGVRLVRLVETLVPGALLSPQLRLPAVSRLQKVHNVGVALAYLQASCGLHLNAVESSCAVHQQVPPSAIVPADIVNGHREKTLALLWKLISHFKLAHVVDADLVAAEIDRVKRRWSALAAQVYSTLQPAGGDADGIPALLLEWCRVVCANYRLAVHNFTASFADGKVLCLMIHYYHPRLLEKSEIQWTTSDRADRDRIGHDEFEALLRQERANFATANAKVKLLGQVPVLVPEFDSSNLPEEKIIVTFVAYLHSRLLGASREIHAAFCLQHWWLPRFRRLRRVKRDRSARVIQRFWYTTSQLRFAIRCVRRQLYLVRKLQAFGRMVICRGPYLRYRAAHPIARSPLRVARLPPPVTPVKPPATPIKLRVTSPEPLPPPPRRQTPLRHQSPPVVLAVKKALPPQLLSPPLTPVEWKAPPAPEREEVEPEDAAMAPPSPKRRRVDISAAATTVQRAVRAWLGDMRASREAFRRVLEQGQAAVRLQQWWRTYVRRARTQAVWRAMAYHTRQLRETAAVVLQRWYTERQTQAFWYSLVYYTRLQRRQVAAATVLQRWLRQRVAADALERTQQTWWTMVVLLRQREATAATRLQAWWRRRLEMVALEHRQATWYALANALYARENAALVLQHWWRHGYAHYKQRQWWTAVADVARYQRLDDAAFVVQLAWRAAKKRAVTAQWHALVGAVLEQRRHDLWEAYVAAAATRVQRAFRGYRRLIAVRRRWRAAIEAAFAHSDADNAAARIQTWYRRLRRRDDVRDFFCRLIVALQRAEAAAVVIQRAWFDACRRAHVRGWFIAVIDALHQHDAAARRIQSAWRTASRVHRVRSYFVAAARALRAQQDARRTEEAACTTLQAFWREYRRRSLLRAWWSHLIALVVEQRQIDADAAHAQAAAGTLQCWWRRRQQRLVVRQWWCECVALLQEQRAAAARVIQVNYRIVRWNRKQRALQDEWRALTTCLGIQQRDAHDAAAAVIQDFYRRYQRKEFTQGWWRDLVEHLLYVESAARVIQAWWAQRRQAPKRSRAASRVPPGEAVVRLQALWRGVLVRRRHDGRSPIAVVRRRLVAAKESAGVVAAALRDHKPLFVQEEKIKLRLRLKRALATLHTSPRLQEMLHAVHTLEMCTRLSRECCVECLLHQVPRLLFSAIRKCNRSRPQLELLHQLLQVVLNLCLHQQGKALASAVAVPDDIEGHAMSAELWIDLMQMHRDSTVLFTLSARLLKFALLSLARDNAEFDGRQAPVLDEARRRLSLLHALMSKRALTKSMVEKHLAAKAKDATGQLHPHRAASILHALLQLFPES